MFMLLSAVAAFSLFGGSSAVLKNVGLDPLTFPGTESGTTVGAVNATNGLVTVSVYQTNRFAGDAAAAMAYSTSYDGGLTWTEGLLPGITKATNAANPYDRVTFQTIVWNAKYHQFMVSTLPISNTPTNGDSDTTLSPIVSTSSDGFHWSSPIAIESGAIRPEKNYLTCDNYQWSPHYGNCYIAWDDNDDNDRFHVNVSSDGGKTWGPTVTAADGHSAYGAVPVVLPNGNVVVPSEDSSGFDGTAQNQIAFRSTDGGHTFGPAYEISPFTAHTVAGNMRTQSLPTVGVDARGTVYSIWQDCRFSTSCAANDFVLSESYDGVNWSAPSRVAVDQANSGADHFIPTLAIQNGLFGPTLALSYYGFPNANCSVATCALTPYESQSLNGGGSWTTPLALSSPMNVTWLASTGAGYMVGDYFQSNFRLNTLGDAPPVTVATAPVNGVLNETTSVSLINSVTSGFGLFNRGAAHSATAKWFTPQMRAARRAPNVTIRRTHHPM